MGTILTLHGPRWGVRMTTLLGLLYRVCQRLLLALSFKGQGGQRTWNGTALPRWSMVHSLLILPTVLQFVLQSLHMFLQGSQNHCSVICLDCVRLYLRDEKTPSASYNTNTCMHLPVPLPAPSHTSVFSDLLYSMI